MIQALKRVRNGPREVVRLSLKVSQLAFACEVVGYLTAERVELNLASTHYLVGLNHYKLIGSLTYMAPKRGILEMLKRGPSRLLNDAWLGRRFGQKIKARKKSL